MACKDIIINIADFNTQDVFTVYVRAIGSFVWSYQRVAISQVTVFESLPDGKYEAYVAKACKDGGTSQGKPKDAVALDCPKITTLSVSGNAGTNATLTWASYLPVAGYEYSLNKLPFVNQAASPKAFTTLISGTVYSFDVRSACSPYLRSEIRSINFQTVPGSPTFKVTPQEIICNGDLYQWTRVRFSYTGGIASVGQTYRVDYTDATGFVYTSFNAYTVQGGDTLYKVMQAWMNFSNPFNVIIDPAGLFCSFDILVHDPRTVYLPRCVDAPLVTGYSVAIV